MGYELGFTIHEYNEDIYRPDDVLWFWCGWENTDLHEAFSRLSREGYIPANADKECHIPVKNLAFIETLHNQVAENDIIKNMHKLFALGKEDYVYNYLDTLPIEKKVVDFYLPFYIEDADENILEICGICLDRTEDGYNIVDSLYHAYQKMLELGLEEIVLYG